MDGSLDNQFEAGPAWKGNVKQVISLSDGGLLVLGQEWVEGELRPRLRRHRAEGSLDVDFNPLLQSGSSLNGLAKSADGTVLAVGRFTEFAGEPFTNVVRLHPDLTVDIAFHPAPDAGELFCAAFALDGRIALGGVVTNPYPNVSVSVLHPDGTRDPGFVAPFLNGDTVARILFGASGNLIFVTRNSSEPWFEFPDQSLPTGRVFYSDFACAAGGATPLLLPGGCVLWAADSTYTLSGGHWLVETLPNGLGNPDSN